MKRVTREKAKDDYDNILIQFPTYDAMHTYYKLNVEDTGRRECVTR